MSQELKNIDEMNVELLKMFIAVRDDPRKAIQARELCNMAGKVINAQKVKLVYALARGEEPDLPFLGSTSGRPLKPNAKLIEGA